MSNIYSTEPNPTGKVILNTTHGPLSLELWCKECPQACRNFIQLCLEGYYDSTVFHRIVPGFCVQGGRSNILEATDEEGEAIFPGGRFAIETHSRLKWTRRGLLGMVSLPAKDSLSNDKLIHGSQFFFSLAEAGSELNGKCSLFGRVVGDTIFNLLRLGEIAVNDDNVPVYPPKIISTEIILNPFDDILPREGMRRQTATLSAKETGKKTIISKALNRKNLGVLSFAEEGEEEESVKSNGTGIKSSHDVLDDPKLSKQSVLEDSKTKTTVASKTNTPTTTTSSSSSSLQFLQQMKQTHLKKLQENINQVERDLGIRKSEEEEEEIKQVKDPQTTTKSLLQKQREEYKKKGKVLVGKRNPNAKDEMDTLLLLNQFRQKIQKASVPEEGKSTEVKESSNPKHLDICKLHGLVNCLSCRDTFGVKAEDESEEGWMMHRLVFDRRELESSIREDLHQLVVIDPREQAEKLTGNKKRS